MSNENKIKLEVDYEEQKIHFTCENGKVGTIRFKTNPLHSHNYYLDTDFESFDLKNAGRVFAEIAHRLDKPLQVMILSVEEEKIAILEAAGFICKRKCYEVEAQKQDYIGDECEGDILYSCSGEEIYAQCCELMLNRYIATHENINPWTGSRDEFFAELPDLVVYNCVGDEVSCFAFVEEEEIAYVYGEDLQAFRSFSQLLVSEMFRKFDSIAFEADDCDEMAMELKSLFMNQDEESFDTYIMQKI